MSNSVGETHVAILIPGFRIFGQERALLNLAETLLANGKRVTVLLHSELGEEALRAYCSKKNIQTHSLPLNTIWSVRLFMKKPRDLWINLTCMRRSSNLMLGLIESEGIDVLIVGNWSFAAYLLPMLYQKDVALIYRHGDAPPK